MENTNTHTAIPGAGTIRRSAIAIPTVIRITSCLFLVSACPQKENKATSGDEGSLSPEAPADEQGAHERGRQNAIKMMKNAEACEPKQGRGLREACMRACRLNHSNSCAVWGELLLPTQPSRALSLFEQACKGGSGVGCEALARRTDDFVEAARLYWEARRYHQVHCDQGYARSCFQLGALFADGLGGDIDRASAAMAQKRGCELVGGEYELCGKAAK